MRLIIVFLCLFSFTATAQTPRLEAFKLGKAIERGELKEKSIEAIGNAIAFGANELKKRGFHEDAERITSEWKGLYKPLLGLSILDIGDHNPIKWLYDVWYKLDDVLGTEIMVMAHLDDIWIFAYSIKVVWQCQDNVSELEYKLHFVPFLGSVTFWTVLIICDIGVPVPWSLLCSPAAMLAEAICREYVAPPLSPKMWTRVCK